MSEGASGILLELIARDRLGRPDAIAIIYEALDMEHDDIDAYRVTLADVPLCTSGPRKGKPNYRACTNKQPLMLTEAEVVAWVTEHGVCRRCANTREVFAGWTEGEGTTMRPCPECDRLPEGSEG